jgi:hypothetical protein
MEVFTEIENRERNPKIHMETQKILGKKNNVGSISHIPSNCTIEPW